MNDNPITIHQNDCSSKNETKKEISKYRPKYSPEEIAKYEEIACSLNSQKRWISRMHNFPQRKLFYLLIKRRSKMRFCFQKNAGRLLYFSNNLKVQKNKINS